MTDTTKENAHEVRMTGEYYRKLMAVVEDTRRYISDCRHGEDCPADPYDYDDGEKPGACECGLDEFRDKIKALEE